MLRAESDPLGDHFQIAAVRQEFNGVSVDKDEALQKRLQRLERDRCINYRRKVHNLQVRLHYALTASRPDSKVLHCLMLQVLPNMVICNTYA